MGEGVAGSESRAVQQTRQIAATACLFSLVQREREEGMNCSRCGRPHRGRRVICYQCRRYLQKVGGVEQFVLGRYVGEMLFNLLWRTQ
jgi:uncharacterized OB-fold protein